jgi:FkbM family methyltransferase
MLPWVVDFPCEDDPRSGIKVRHIVSGNDGDVCISYVTHTILSQASSAPLRCLDIGVDEGWWSLFVLDHFPNVVLDSFEPSPKSYATLLEHIGDDPRITLHNFAISDKTGLLPFTEDGGQSHSRCETSTRVPCEPISRFIGDGQIDLIKIDTEGHDLIILNTLFPFLDKISAIIFECTTYWNGRTEEECISTTIDVLQRLKQSYAHMYMLSRRGEPTLTEFMDNQDIEDFANSCYESTSQVDIVVSRTPISLPNPA